MCSVVRDKWELLQSPVEEYLPLRVPLRGSFKGSLVFRDI